VTVIVLLSMPSGQRRAIAFVVGWLFAVAAIGTASVLLLHGRDFSRHETTPSRAASAVEIVVGCVVVLLSMRAFRRRTRNPADADMPKWLARHDETNWLLAILVGSFMLTYSLTLAAAAEILKADVSATDDVLAFVVFALASIVSIVAPILVVVVAPERSEKRLAEWRAWLLGNSRAIGLIALMVIGVLLAARGIHYLAA
jgi:hypothetical protein